MVLRRATPARWLWDTAFAQRAATRTEQQMSRAHRQVAQHVVFTGVATDILQAQMPALSQQPVLIAIVRDSA